MRGVIAAGEWADAPAPAATPKSLTAVHHQPLIYHSIALLLLAGVRHILVVATPSELPHFQQCLGDGAAWGIDLSYAVAPIADQARADTALQALLLASEFIADQPVFLASADYLLHGDSLPATLQQAATLEKGARVFSHSTCEDALPGVGFYDHTAAARARALLASGSATLAELNNAYRAEHALEVLELGEQVTWLHIDTRAALSAAGELLRQVEKKHGVKASAPLNLQTTQ